MTLCISSTWSGGESSKLQVVGLGENSPGCGTYASAGYEIASGICGGGGGWLVEWGPLHPQRSSSGVADAFRTVPQGLCSTRSPVRGRRCGAVGNR